VSLVAIDYQLEYLSRSASSGGNRLDRGTLSSPLDLHGGALAKDFLSGALDDTSNDGEAGVLLQVDVNLPGCASTFVDAPRE
jgi:hypothetical protein